MLPLPNENAQPHKPSRASGVGPVAVTMACAVFAIGACASAESATLTPVTVSGDTGALAPNAVVVRVIDGDTLVADISGRSEPVRLIGIDTPESVARTRPVECYGQEASVYLQQLLPVGTDITLLLDSEARDAYNRLLAYVLRSEDNLFVNLELVEQGYAAALNIAPNDHYAGAFSGAETAAIASGKGLWSACGGPDVPMM